MRADAAQLYVRLSEGEMKKVIVVFANSVKHKKHCIAGKEIQTKQWIRPVGNSAGAELDYNQCICENPYGKFPVKLLQKVEIDLAENTPLANQPENFLIGSGLWTQKYRIEEYEIVHYLDKPDSLWGTGNRVAFYQIDNGTIKIEQSLYLVKVENLEIYKNMDKRRASFSYNGNHYDLPVTDPNFEKYIQNPKYQSILCVSLGEKYDSAGGENYSCYKIVVAIF